MKNKSKASLTVFSFLFKMLVFASPIVFSLLFTTFVFASPGNKTSFCGHWKFKLGEIKGAEKTGFDDSTWRNLSLPHDWSIEGPFDQNCPGGAGTGYLPGGVGWYRKTFKLPEESRGKRIFLDFDGVYMDSRVWINGKLAGSHPYGYTSFRLEITHFVNYGEKENIAAVSVKVKQPCSRWYSGAGIYRRVWLIQTSPLHVAHWGTYVTTPRVSSEKAEAVLRVRIQNQDREDRKISLCSIIFDPEGNPVAKATSKGVAASGSEEEFSQEFTIKNPKLWSPGSPFLYKVISKVISREKVVDECTTPLGIRTFRFTVDKGFFLNGNHVDLKGVCLHHDYGCIGSVYYSRALQRRLQILKDMGCNAIRTSHNPRDPEFYTICDRLGFLVMDEAFDEWKASKTRYGYGRFFDEWSGKDLSGMILRDRNHPSIIMWSIGNEIPEQRSKKAYQMSKRLVDICKRLDPTRPVTSACNSPKRALSTGFARPLDVVGINYNIGVYKQEKGKMKLVASETSSDLSSRGEYEYSVKGDELIPKKKFNHQCTSYDLCSPGWGYTAEVSLKALKNSKWIAGEFVWTGFDYIGEPTPYRWPSRSSYFGIVDLVDFPKDRFYLYKSCWSDEPVVHIVPQKWNWSEYKGKKIPVWCYSNCDKVELFLNGKSLGVKEPGNGGSLHLEWKVGFEPGVLKAEGLKDGRISCSDVVFTAGKPAGIVMTSDRKEITSDGLDLGYIRIEIVDSAGHICPDASLKINLDISGEGEILGVGNGNPVNHEPFKAKKHHTFHGLCRVVVKSTTKPGTIKITAKSGGLKSATISIGTSMYILSSSRYKWSSPPY